MKKVVLFVTAIALVIALAATGVLASNKTTETGKVDGKVEATASSDSNKTLPNENSKRIDETLEPNEESDAINDKITPESGKVDAEANVEIGWNDERLDEATKKVAEKYTVGTLHDFGVKDWRSSYDTVYVVPLSEYKELDEKLQFLNEYDFYIPSSYLDDIHSEDYSLNGSLLGYVRFAREGIEESIANGESWEDGIYNFLTNVVQVHFTWEQVFYAVADYYYGYNVATSFSATNAN